MEANACSSNQPAETGADATKQPVIPHIMRLYLRHLSNVAENRKGLGNLQHIAPKRMLQ